MNCEISAVLIWVRGASGAGGGAHPLKRAKVVSGVSDGAPPSTDDSPPPH